MAELEVDQSSLPKVQEVCQGFAVLEDGALAHNLQEQEIEQYYSSNVQRSQLVQNDIRVAKRLQDEEQQRAYVLHRQTTQQLEEQDSEYARRIQEELQRCAEEARRREAEDEEIAKQIQEEEELLVRQQTSCRRTDIGENTTIPALRNALRPARPLVSEEEEQCDWASHSRAYSPSPSTSDYEEERCERRRHVSQDYGDGLKQRRRPIYEPPRRNHLGQEHRSSVSQSSHLGQEDGGSVSQSSHLEEDRRSSISQSSRTGRFQGGWGDVVRLIKNDLSVQGYLSCSSDDELFEPVYRLERIFSQRKQAPNQHGGRDKRLSRHSSVREASSRTWQGECASRTQSFRVSEYSDSRSVRSDGRRVRRYNSSCSDSRPGDGQRHVHFQDDARGRNRYSKSQRTFEGSHGGTRERELGSYTASSYPVRGYSQVYPTTANGVQYQTHPQGFQQCAQVRNIRHGDFQVGRRASYNYGELQQANGGRHFESSPSQEFRVREEEEEWERDSRGVRGEHRRRAHSLREERVWQATESRRYNGNHRERRIWQGDEEESSSSEEEEVERERRGEERRVRRLPQRSLSLACRGRSPRAGSVLRRDGASLDLGELEQVLLDEELARRLQDEEERFLGGGPQSTSHIQRSYPEGDFRVAQVAQDEEIARFMQKQEIKVKQQSQELVGCYERQVQRERLDSEGLLSPTEECSPEYQPPSPIAMATQQHQYRNIAEELDPTFHRKENMAGSCQIQDTPEAGSLDLMGEPTFVPPTKRHSDKPVRVKSKEKKEHTKSKENCKQQ
ncbi:hypothetical protein SRHO_G00149560 [Serrasalmus rhombeus]